MAKILKQHNTVAGWLVMLSVSGKPVTLRFDSQPSEADLTEAITRFEERMLNETEIGGEETDVLSQ